MLGPCGARYSIDRLWRLRRGAQEVPPSVAANIAIRLIQVHMCIIYLFSGLGKTAGRQLVVPARPVWLSFANLEYQSLDMTWLASHPAAQPHDPRHRLLGAVLLRLGLAAAHAAVGAADGRVRPRRHRLRLGMPTFGLVMLIGNLAFVSPQDGPQSLRPARPPNRRWPSSAKRAGQGQRPT